jgi:membrane protein YdbS with pleckstrin-like domain
MDTPDVVINSSETWQSVDPNYSKLLRVNLVIWTIVAVLVLGFFIWIMPELKIFFQIVAAAYFLIMIWLFWVWVPKTLKRLKYVLHDEDIQLQKGYLYWRQLAIAANRIQHIEVTQGPLERYLGLASLVIYTAGSIGSDMKLPGLCLETAQEIRVRLLEKIKSEESGWHESL